MQDLEYIDNYFKGALPAEETGRFEQRILADTPFAETVSFYFASVLAAREQLMPEKKQRFNGLYRQYKEQHTPSLLRQWLPYAAAAAALAAVFLVWWLWPVAPQQMARAYEQQQFASLPVTMAARPDSLQAAISQYNEGKAAQALLQFETILSRNESDILALKYAGIVSLELRQYDKALLYFGRLRQAPGLYSNPGKFYYALTLMKRSMPGDQPKAKQLLQQVVQEGLENAEMAKQWLRKW